jgi:ribosome-binding protein aMBF1 (putative translation factor)
MQEVLPWLDAGPPLQEESEIESVGRSSDASSNFQPLHSNAKPTTSPTTSNGVFSITSKFRRTSEDKKSVFQSKTPTSERSQEILSDIPLADIMKRIAHQRGWSQTELNQDLQTLQKQRLRTVEEAKLLSPASWNELGLLPLVRDLLKRELKL